jgi:PAS domain S-box-containing protein
MATRRRKPKPINAALRSLKLAVETMQIGVTVTDLKGRIVYTNAADARLHGYEPKELIGKPVRVYAPEDRWKRMSPRQVRELKSWKRESVNIRKDGTLFPVLLRSDVVHDRRGKPVAIVTTCEEISDRKRVEGALRQSEARFRSVIESNMIGMSFGDLSGHVTEANGAYLRMLGYTWEDLLGGRINWADMTPPEYGNLDRAALQELLSRGVVTPYEKEFVRKDGSRVAVLVGGAVLAGSRDSIVTFVLDISVRKRAERALLASEVKFRSVAQSANDAIIATDGQGIVTSWNNGAERMLWYSEAEALGKPIAFLLPGRLRSRYQRELVRGARRLDARRGFQMIEMLALRKDETEIPVEISLASWKVGGRTFYSGIVRDLTERRRTEQAMLEREKAIESERLKSEFLATVSHELRTPLNAVIGMIELLIDTRLSEEQRRYADAVRNSGNLLLTLIDDLLDVTKVEAGKLELEVADFSVVNLVQDTADIFLARIREKGLEFHVRVAPEVPALVRGDGRRIGQVLMNLLGNALKFTVRGTISLSVSAEEAGAAQVRLRFEVADTGIGVPPEAVERIFEPFVQAESSTTRRFGGTGLGLTICKRLVERMGGTIGLESRPGQGSRFHFSLLLPRSSADAAAAAGREAPAPQAAVPALVAAAAGLPVLVAEDNALNREVTLIQLRKLGLKGRGVVNGKEAVEAAARGPFAAILMDLQMPVMDGYEAARAIRDAERATGRRIPIIAISANPFEADRRNALAAGMDDYLCKPVRAAEVGRILARWLSGEDSAEARPSAVDPAVLDGLLELQMEGEPDIIVTLTDIFLKAGPDRLGELRRAAEALDARALERAAHALKSSSAQLGARRLAALCASLEDGARSRPAELGRVPAAVAAIEAEYAQAQAELEGIRSRRS